MNLDEKSMSAGGITDFTPVRTGVPPAFITLYTVFGLE
jgi:hypothetical protein